jgi:hypothetical protein
MSIIKFEKYQNRRYFVILLEVVLLSWQLRGDSEFQQFARQTGGMMPYHP